MRNGTISLFNRIEELIDSKPYKCPATRESIVSRWKMLYSSSFINCIIHIEPSVDINLVDSWGRNKRTKDFPYSMIPHSKDKNYFGDAVFANKSKTRQSNDVRNDYYKPSH